MYPKIYLALDNCFGIKRWTEPDEWMKISKEVGIHYIEASADNECDPFYGGKDYLKDWIQKVEKSQIKYQSKVANFFTGYSTYRTLGLLHPDRRIRDRLVNKWFKEIIQVASTLNAGLGFFVHAFSQPVLQDPEVYQETKNLLFDTISLLIEFASSQSPSPVLLMLEQMYSPHQYPWTINGTFEYLKEVYKRSKFPSYIALDTGHMVGQRRFLRPSQEQLEELFSCTHVHDLLSNFWLGSDSVRKIVIENSKSSFLSKPNFIELIEAEMDRYPYLFADPDDGDLYSWLKAMGCYSPIIHLQQTNGRTSSHQPFTRENNLKGIVHPKKVLQALVHSYQEPTNSQFPPKCKEIYLTFEIFNSSIDYPLQIINRLRESVDFWREFIPQDGLTLDVLVK